MDNTINFEDNITYLVTINDSFNDPLYDLIVEKKDCDKELKELSIVVSWLIRNGIRFTLTYEDNSPMYDFCKGGDTYE